MTTLAEYENRVKPVHVRGCPCDDCYDARLARIMAAWVELGDFNQRDLASMFVQRFDGRRGRWMEFKTFPSTPSAGHWEPAQTILDAAGGLIATLCGDSASDAARWGKLAVYKDVLALAREHLTIDQWDAWGEVLGLTLSSVDSASGPSPTSLPRLTLGWVKSSRNRPCWARLILS